MLLVTPAAARRRALQLAQQAVESTVTALERYAAEVIAVIEIGGLTDQAAAAAQAVRESMRQVSLAAAALALPEPTAG